MMEYKELKKILVNHKKYLETGDNSLRANLQKADLRYADLQYANLREADLQKADLQYANLQEADLQKADLQKADLQKADLRYADLQYANLDFSCFPLYCGSFNIVDDGHIAKQILSHVARLDIKDKKLAEWVKSIPKEYKNEFCKRHDIAELKK